MRVLFIKDKLYDFYVDDESDMQDIYYRFESYFKDKEWILEGTHAEIEDLLYEKMWKPLNRGDYILQRYINSKLAIEIE